MKLAGAPSVAEVPGLGESSCGERRRGLWIERVGWADMLGIYQDLPGARPHEKDGTPVAESTSDTVSRAE